MPTECRDVWTQTVHRESMDDDAQTDLISVQTIDMAQQMATEQKFEPHDASRANKIKSNSSSGAEINIEPALPSPQKPIILAPKRPLSPFIFFSQEARRQLKQKHPDLHSQKISKLVQQQWKLMSASEKKIYVDLSLQNRQQYEVDKNTFDQIKLQNRCATGEIEETVKTRRRNKKSERIALKRPPDSLPKKRGRPVKIKTNSLPSEELNNFSFNNPPQQPLDLNRLSSAYCMLHPGQEPDQSPQFKTPWEHHNQKTFYNRKPQSPFDQRNIFDSQHSISSMSGDNGKGSLCQNQYRNNSEY